MTLYELKQGLANKVVPRELIIFVPGKAKSGNENKYADKDVLKLEAETKLNNFYFLVFKRIFFIYIINIIDIVLGHLIQVNPISDTRFIKNFLNFITICFIIQNSKKEMLGSNSW